MSCIEDGWFREINEMWSGYCVSLQIEEILHQEKSKFQEILVFKSKSFGNVLVLDGIIQCTERDEHAYQEMIAHLPLSCHENPKQVLVVGGGDGGVVREVLKNTCVQRVVLCEIDERVIEVCKEHLPSMASCLDDPKVTVFVGDGIKYMKEHKGEFDVIITDAPDPIGAAAGLYEESYYASMKAALRPGGIICCQGENLYLDLPLVQKLMRICRQNFPAVGYAYTLIPTYTGGHIGFVLTSTNPDVKFNEPRRIYKESEIKMMKMKYYNSDIHKASFVIPQFAKEALEPVSNGVSDT